MHTLRIFRVLSLLAAVMMLSFAASSAWASMLVSNAYYSGSRATVGTTGSGGGLLWNPAAGSWSGGNFEISWLITDNGPDYTYKYTVDTTGGMDMSHWILPLSTENADGQSLQDHWEAIFVDQTEGDYSGTGVEPEEVKIHVPGPGNPGLPSGLYGIKFEADEELAMTMVEFTTSQPPVWGDFYAKDGGGVGAGAIWAHNAGFGIMPAVADAANGFLNWIPRPNGLVIPEPASAMLALSVLLGAALFRRRSR